MKVILLIVAVVVAAAAVIGSRHHGAAPSTPGPGSTTDAAVPNDSGQTVVLEVVGDADSMDAGATAMITWGDAGAISQLTTSLPWTAPAGTPATLSAQSQNETTVLTCRILQGKEVLQESTEATAYGICSVSWAG